MKSSPQTSVANTPQGYAQRVTAFWDGMNREGRVHWLGHVHMQYGYSCAMWAELEAKDAPHARALRAAIVAEWVARRRKCYP